MPTPLYRELQPWGWKEGLYSDTERFPSTLTRKEAIRRILMQRKNMPIGEYNRLKRQYTEL